MTFSIEEFKSNGLVHGGARQSLFEVYMPPDFPDISLSNVGSGSGQDVTKKISFLAMAASLPPSNVDYIDVPYMSRKIRVSGDRTFPDWVMTCMNDEDFMIRRALEGWHEAINSREPNRMAGSGFGDIKMYKRNLLVKQFGKTGATQNSQSNATTQNSDAQPIYQYTLVGAFPTAIDAINLDWGAVNQIEQFDITFAYDYWQPYDITSGIGQNPQNASFVPSIHV